MSSSIPIRCGCAESNIIPIPSLRTAISWSCNEKGNIIMTLKITWWVSYKKLLTCAYPSMGSSMCLIGFVSLIVLVFNVVCFCFVCVRFCFCFFFVLPCVHCWLCLWISCSWFLRRFAPKFIWILKSALYVFINLKSNVTKYIHMLTFKSQKCIASYLVLANFMSSPLVNYQCNRKQTRLVLFNGEFISIYKMLLR